MACDAAFARESRAGNPDAEVAPKALAIGATVAGVRSALVEHLQMGRRQVIAQLPLNFADLKWPGSGARLRGQGVVSVFMCLLR